MQKNCQQSRRRGQILWRSRILFLYLVFWSLACDRPYSKPTPTQPSSKTPNIIYLLADDLGYEDLGVYGSPSITTPRLDRLAKEGLRFTQYYSNGSVCSPTRAALHTGSYPSRWGFRDGIKAESRRGLPSAIATLPAILQQAGYETWHIGKWHLGHSEDSYQPLKQGYDRFFGFLHAWQLPKTYQNPRLRTGTETAEVREGHLTDLLTDRAIDWIGSKTAKNPYFLSLWYFAPHKPLEPPGRWESRYPKTQWGRYGALVSTLDENVGRLLDTLEATETARETVVIFASDNGGVTSLHGGMNGPLRGGKNQLFEGGIRVPLIVRWPGRVSAGVVEDSVVLSHDWLPTLAEVAGVDLGSWSVDGSSLGPLLQGEKRATKPTPVFWEKSGAKGYSFAVRQGFWKLLQTEDERFLFDLEKDIGETRNLALEYPETVHQLEIAYWRWRRQVTHIASLPMAGNNLGEAWKLQDDPRLDPDDGDLSVTASLCRGNASQPDRWPSIAKGSSWSLGWDGKKVEISAGAMNASAPLVVPVGDCLDLAWVMTHRGSVVSSLPGSVELWIEGEQVLQLATQGPISPNSDPVIADPPFLADQGNAGWTKVSFWVTRLTPLEIRELSSFGSKSS